MTPATVSHVIPAQAGIQNFGQTAWIPACAGMTGRLIVRAEVNSCILS